MNRRKSSLLVLAGLFYLQVRRDLMVLRLKGYSISVATTCILWVMVHVLHVADEMRFGEPLPSGWEHSSSIC